MDAIIKGNLIYVVEYGIIIDLDKGIAYEGKPFFGLATNLSAGLERVVDIYIKNRIVGEKNGV